MTINRATDRLEQFQLLIAYHAVDPNKCINIVANMSEMDAKHLLLEALLRLAMLGDPDHASALENHRTTTIQAPLPSPQNKFLMRLQDHLASIETNAARDAEMLGTAYFETPTEFIAMLRRLAPERSTTALNLLVEATGKITASSAQETK